MSVRTIKRGNSRFYIDPTDPNTKVPGVTSILNMLPKDFLGPWNGKMSAEFTADNIGPIVGLLVSGQRQAAIDMIKGAARRFTKDAADLGSDAHDLFERLARGESIPENRVHADLRPFRTHFLEFLDVAQPEFLHIEETVWSDTYGYAGSFDSIARIDGETVIVDFKTTRSGVHAQTALQNIAYARADRIIIAATGESIPLPEIDASAVLHVRPEGWKMHPLSFEDADFDYFLGLRETFDWDSDRSKRVIGNPVFAGGFTETGTQRRGR
ncbi:hypothetical protein [Streptomyces sp. SM12]|uniref:hypothetical protein n=1 Tax=Streptomyces sp. SM12 TaxID=1071602 RepID=UPI000CD4E42B|nr:hypothetical protein [Streptomyces sp. SM12]